MYDFKSIDSILGDSFQVVGSIEKIQFDSFLPIEDAGSSSLAWLSPDKPNKLEVLERTKASSVIVSLNETIISSFPDINFILVKNPKLVYQRIVQNLFYERELSGLHPSVELHSKAKLGKNVNVGPYSYIGNSVIGDNVFIHGHVYIYDNVTIGNNVVIQAGTVIGSDGFGLTRNENNEFENFPHIGGVIIEDNVEIGSNTSIDRGTLGNTLLKKGCKIDNLVHVAHNVEVGMHTAVVANSMIGGSTIIGDYCWVAPSTAIIDRVSIPPETTLGLGSIVIKPLKTKGTYTGNPARSIKEISKIQAFFKEVILK
jgi:UDP-3-O-[3-hydroxymyristoyl] glucosamine N-acyltransferase